MSLSPSISIDVVTNSGVMNLFNNLNLFATYEFSNSDVTVSAIASPITVDFTIFEANVVFLEKWIILIKENLDILWTFSEEFVSQIQTKPVGLSASYKLNQFLSNLTYDSSSEVFTILPAPSQTVTFPIFERWSKFLRRVSDDARLFT